MFNSAQVYLKKTCWYNLPHSVKFVPILTKPYANVSGSQARVWNYSQAQRILKKKVVACRKKVYYFKTEHTRKRG